jgi:hypothetical protein
MSRDHPAEQAHCGRTAALAVELGRRAGVAAEPLLQAALLHHSLEPLRHSSGLGRLAWQVVAGDDARRIADIVQVCNLVDEQLEALEFEYKEIDVILEKIRALRLWRDSTLLSWTTCGRCAAARFRAVSDCPWRAARQAGSSAN